MKVVYSEEYKQVYSYDPASNPGRIESIEFALAGKVDYVEPQPASEEDIAAVHTSRHIAEVRREGVHEIAALAAGGAIKAAEIGLSEPCFAVIRPPGHHASADTAWGFCYFNNMAIALTKLKKADKIKFWILTCTWGMAISIFWVGKVMWRFLIRPARTAMNTSKPSITR